MTGLPHWLTDAIGWAYGHSPTWALTLWVVLAVLATLGAVASLVLSWKRKGRSAKLGVGFGAVQVGMSYVLLTGVYQFWHGRLAMVGLEATIIALFIEALAWMLAGFVHEHGQQDGSEGFGPAGPLFWAVIAGGGTLAVLGSASSVTGVGRVVVVVMAGCAWYLRLRTWTRQPSSQSRWVWTPKRLLIAMGALAPDDGDLLDNPDEWTIRRLTRATQWSNSRQPWKWLGDRMLARRSGQTQEHLHAAARRRAVAADLMMKQSAFDNPLMISIRDDLIVSQQAAATCSQTPEQVDWNRFGTEITALAEQVRQLRREQMEQAAATSAEQDRLSAELHAIRRGLRAPEPRQEQARNQGRARPMLASVRPDEQIADDLFDKYREQMEATGQPLTRYRVEQDGACSQKQAERVLELLGNRWRNRSKEQVDGTESDADSEHTQGAVS